MTATQPVMFVVAPTGLSGPLYHKDQVPEHFHESFIVKGYRNPKSSPFRCLLSLFDATNETLNFWTHFLPSWYFVWVLKGLSDTLDFKNDSYTWPLLGYMCMCCIYPLASSTAHTFNTMSDNARHICFFLDYSAISAMSLSVAVAYRAYSFPVEWRHTWLGDMFIPLAAINAFLCIILSCETRLMRQSSVRKFLRLSALGMPCLYDTIPLSYRLLCGTESEMKLTSCYHHAIGIFLMFVSGFLYGAHLPERLFPGSFDIIGHSHQLFHVCVIVGTMEQVQGILNDMREKEAELRTHWEFQPIMSTVGLLGGVLLVNTIIVILFSLRLKRGKFRVKGFKHS